MAPSTTSLPDFAALARAELGGVVSSDSRFWVVLGLVKNLPPGMTRFDAADALQAAWRVADEPHPYEEGTVGEEIYRAIFTAGWESAVKLLVHLLGFKAEFSQIVTALDDYTPNTRLRMLDSANVTALLAAASDEEIYEALDGALA